MLKLYVREPSITTKTLRNATAQSNTSQLGITLLKLGHDEEAILRIEKAKYDVQEEILLMD